MRFLETDQRSDCVTMAMSYDVYVNLIIVCCKEKKTTSLLCYGFDDARNIKSENIKSSFNNQCSSYSFKCMAKFNPPTGFDFTKP